MTIDSKRLNEVQVLKIGKILSRAIGNKQHSHTRDLRKAALIFYHVQNLGYAFGELDLEEVIERLEDHYSNSVREDLRLLNNDLYELTLGMNDSILREYRVTEEDLIS